MSDESRFSHREEQEKNFPNWYDQSINWDGRLQREIPILTDVLGPPGAGGLMDAGCGTGRHLVALAELGYRVTGADISPQMCAIAKKNAREAGVDVSVVETDFASLFDSVGGGFDGLFCLANSLPNAGTAPAVAATLKQFSACLRVGGRFVIEVLNFTPMLPGIRDGFVDDDQDDEGFLLNPSSVEIARVVIPDEDELPVSPEKEKYRLYPISVNEFRTFCVDAGLRIDEQWGSVMRDPFEVNRSVDMISVGTRV